MSYNQTNNVWMVCLNCEIEISLEELFADEEESTVECPVCSGHSFRRSDAYGSDSYELYDYRIW